MVTKKKKIIASLAGAVAIGGMAYGVYSMSKRHTTESSSSKINKSDSESTGTDTGTGSASSTGSGSESSNTTKKTVVEEIPITTYEEAYDFAVREWNKIKRDNGRQLECQTIGSSNWICGEWCKVYLPSFDIDGYMYITRTSQTSEGGDWTCSLTLVDYPPGWGKEEVEENTEEESEEDSEDEEESDEDSE